MAEHTLGYRLTQTLGALDWGAIKAAPLFGVDRKALGSWMANRTTPPVSRAAHVEALVCGLEALTGDLETGKAWLEAHGCAQERDQWGYRWSPYYPPKAPSDVAVLAARIVLRGR